MRFNLHKSYLEFNRINLLTASVPTWMNSPIMQLVTQFKGQPVVHLHIHRSIS